MPTDRSPLPSILSFLRRLIFLVCTSFLALSCGRREPGTSEVTFAVALLPSEQPAYLSVLKTFTEKTGIRVKLVAQQYTQIRSTIEAEAQAGRGQLDLIELDVYLLPLLKPFMQPLDTLMSTLQDLQKHVQEDVWEAARFNTGQQEIYFAPHRLNWQAMFYDATILPVPPDNWEGLLQVAKQHAGKIGLKLAKYEGLVCDIFPFLWQAGGDPLQPNTPATLKTMRFLLQLLPAVNSSARTYKENSVLQAQEHQEVIIHWNWPFAVPLLREKGLLNTRVKTAPLPNGPAGRATILGGGYLGIPATAQNAIGAARLLDFLTSAETQRELAATLGWFPVREEGWEGMSETDKEAFAGFLAMKDFVRARPNVPYYEQVSRIWQDGIYRVFFEGMDPGEALAEMQRMIDNATRGQIQ